MRVVKSSNIHLHMEARTSSYNSSTSLRNIVMHAHCGLLYFVCVPDALFFRHSKCICLNLGSNGFSATQSRLLIKMDYLINASIKGIICLQRKPPGMYRLITAIQSSFLRWHRLIQLLKSQTILPEILVKCEQLHVYAAP